MISPQYWVHSHTAIGLIKIYSEISDKNTLENCVFVLYWEMITTLQGQKHDAAPTYYSEVSLYSDHAAMTSILSQLSDCKYWPSQVCLLKTGCFPGTPPYTWIITTLSIYIYSRWIPRRNTDGQLRRGMHSPYSQSKLFMTKHCWLIHDLPSAILNQTACNTHIRNLRYGLFMTKHCCMAYTQYYTSTTYAILNY